MKYVCDVCGWENSIAQYDDHDYAEAQNALSVNELRLEYQLLTDEKTKDKTETYRKSYREERDKVYAVYRARRKALEPFSCEDVKGQCVSIRLDYVEKLKMLVKSN